MESISLHQDSNPLPDLPLEVIIDILSRLPVKSLLKFRCVCKSWLSLISTSQFIKTHLKSSTNSNKYANHAVILRSSTAPITYYTCSLHSSLFDTTSINAVELDIPMRDLNYHLWVVGSCNGLLCVSLDPDTLILYNPSLKKFNNLPISGSHLESSSYIAYGFGYDEVNDDYKIVELCGYVIGFVELYKEAYVYSLRSNSWKLIEDYPNGPVSGASGIFVNGKLHWSAAGSGGLRYILSLDLVTEEYSIVGRPKCGDGEASWILLESGGRLCMCGEYYKNFLEVWVMKEYGVEDTWTKLVTIPYPVDLSSTLCPVFVTKNVEVLLSYEPCVMYNSRDSTFETREMYGGGGVDGDALLVVAPTYIESLVPPGFDGLYKELLQDRKEAVSN